LADICDTLRLYDSDSVVCTKQLLVAVLEKATKMADYEQKIHSMS